MRQPPLSRHGERWRPHRRRLVPDGSGEWGLRGGRPRPRRGVPGTGEAGPCACPSMWDELRQAVEFQPCEMAPECLSRDFVEPARVLT